METAFPAFTKSFPKRGFSNANERGGVNAFSASGKIANRVEQFSLFSLKMRFQIGGGQILGNVATSKP